MRNCRPLPDELEPFRWSRREFLLGLSGWMIGSWIAVPPLAQAQPSVSEPYGDRAAAELWMDEWMSEKKAAGGVLHLSRFADPVYFLISEIGWMPNPDQANAYTTVRVPVGFVTDFASIPRAFWSILRPDGLYTYPAIVHDYLYWEQTTSREVADQILRFGMEDFKVDPITIGTIYAAVRAGGGFAWENNKRMKEAGGKRILRRFPEDPTIRWSQWRTDPSVF
jgi:hypothetical protein